jgi:creatinine amidohydrolase
MSYELASLTTRGFAALVEAEAPFVILQSVGSVEPHGPHMTLVADTVISEAAAVRAAAVLEADGIACRLAPAIPYGVTECAAAFAGAVSIEAPVLTAFLGAVVRGYLGQGVSHVCLVNNPLAPAHDAAVRAALAGIEPARASVACPLTRRWARTLSAEFRSGACHAGRYETSIVMAAAPALVDEAARAGLPEVPISLAEKLGAGVTDFVEMGLAEAYAGSPADATAAEGSEQLTLLAHMIVTEVRESLARG